VYVFPVLLPPLRERREDIPALVQHFAAQVITQNGWKPVPFHPDAIACLQQYSWPGNIRELRNTVERLLLLATDGEVDLNTVRATLPASQVTAGVVTASSQGPLASRVEQFEREVLLSELKRNNYHVTNTAKALGLERSHLYKKAEQLGIDLQAARKSSAEGA
jgi:two-component system nitrogen regulation response regulator NtrX